MERTRPALVGLALALALASTACTPVPNRSGAPPVDVTGEPEQTAPTNAPVTFERKGWSWTITPRAHYVVRGLVLSRETYRMDSNAMLSPCDLALAWGPLVAQDAYKEASFSQSSRWYLWQLPAGAKLDNDFIADHSANTHVIPATENVARAACGLSAGDRVELEGDLVDVKGAKGERWFEWHSSQSRHDRGAGSCEVMYVRRVTHHGDVFE